MEQRLIDANAIYDKVEANYRMSEGLQHECEREFLNLICDAPTVDAVPVVHGKWVLKERAHYFKCSLCKEPIAYRFGYGGDRYYNYCPRCGARMEGADGENKMAEIESLDRIYNEMNETD